MFRQLFEHYLHVMGDLSEGENIMIDTSFRTWLQIVTFKQSRMKWSMEYTGEENKTKGSSSKVRGCACKKH